MAEKQTQETKAEREKKLTTDEFKRLYANKDFFDKDGNMISPRVLFESNQEVNYIKRDKGSSSHPMITVTVEGFLNRMRNTYTMTKEEYDNLESKKELNAWLRERGYTKATRLSGDDILVIMKYDKATGEVVFRRGKSTDNLETLQDEIFSLSEFEKMMKNNTETKTSGKGRKRKEIILSPMDEAGNVDDTYEERDPARAGAAHTLYKLGQHKDETFDSLIPDEISKDVKVADGEEGFMTRVIDYDWQNPDPAKRAKIDKAMEKRFHELTRKLWDLLIVHGYAEEQENGTYKMTKEISDLDGESCLTLCRMAGLDNAKVKYVPQGRGEDDESLTMDTSEDKEGRGNIGGIVALEGGKRVIADHHSEKSGRDTSATKYTYEFLIANGILKKEDYLDDFIQFVTEEDNKDYSGLEIDLEERFRNSWQTLRGLRKYISPEKILKLFRDARVKGEKFNPDASLADEILDGEDYKFVARTDDKYDLMNNGKTLRTLSGFIKDKIEKSEKAINDLVSRGLVFDTGDNNYGKILIDPGIVVNGKRQKSISLGHEAAMIFGYDTLLNWDQIGNGMVLYTNKKLDDDFRLSQGFRVREKMWMKKTSDKESLQVTPKEIFSKLSKKIVRIPDELKKAFEKENLAIDLPDGAELPGGAEKKENGVKKEIRPEMEKEMHMVVKSYSKHGKSFMKLYAKKGPFEIKGKDEKETNEMLRAKVEEFVRDGVSKFDGASVGMKKFNQKELDEIIKQIMENILSNKK